MCDGVSVYSHTADATTYGAVLHWITMTLYSAMNVVHWLVCSIPPIVKLENQAAYTCKPWMYSNAFNFITIFWLSHAKSSGTAITFKHSFFYNCSNEADLKLKKVNTVLRHWLILIKFGKKNPFLLVFLKKCRNYSCIVNNTAIYVFRQISTVEVKLFSAILRSITTQIEFSRATKVIRSKLEKMRIFRKSSIFLAYPIHLYFNIIRRFCYSFKNLNK